MLDKTSSAYERANASANSAFAGGASFDAVVSKLVGSGYSAQDASEIAADVQEARRAYFEKTRWIGILVWITVVVAMLLVAPLGIYVAALTLVAVESNPLGWLCIAIIVVGGPLTIGGFAAFKLYRLFKPHQHSNL